MQSHKSLTVVFALLIGLSLAVPASATDGPAPAITPDSVDVVLFPGQGVEIAKTVTTPEIPPMVEVCLLEDETGSFWDDIDFLQAGTTAEDIYDAVKLASPNAEFAVAGFRDYPIPPYGGPDDWVYRLLSPMSPDKADWVNGIGALTAGGGADDPEAQYDAIVAAAGAGLGDQGPCGFSTDPSVTKVLVVTTDAAFHTPDGTHVNDQTSTLTALGDIVVVGLKAPGAGTELDALASATVGSVQALSSNGANIAAAILAGLKAIEVDVAMVSDCEWPISTAFDPASQPVTSGDDAGFTETISVAADAPGGTYFCRDWALIDGEPMRDGSGGIIYEQKTVKVPEGFLTGGGQIGKAKKAGKNFAGNVGYLADFTIVGQWQFNDRSYNHGEGLKLHSTSIRRLQFFRWPGEGPEPPDANANAADFEGTARVKIGHDPWIYGCHFEVYAEDHGEPARKGDQPDMLLIGVQCPGEFDVAWSELSTGNLQIHSGIKN